VAGKCIWIQRGTNAGDVHISESGFTGLSTGVATCNSCGTEVGKFVINSWYERIRSRRGGDRYTAASSTFIEQLGDSVNAARGRVVEREVRAPKG